MIVTDKAKVPAPTDRSGGTPLLEMTDIQVSFGGSVALRCERFALRPGEIVGLLGHNGAGKSTLVNVATGAIRPQSGTMSVSGQAAPLRGNPREMEALGIKVIHQQPALADNLSIADNIVMERPQQRRSAAERRQYAVDALDLLDSRLNVDRPVGSLTFGEKQLVDLARALSTDIKALFLDEPTGALGQHEADRLHDLLRMLAAQGRGIVYVSHRLKDILSVCTRLVVLQGGQVMLDCKADDLSLAELSNALAPGLKDRSVAARKDTEGGEGMSIDWHGQTLSFPRGAITGLFGMAGGPQFRLLETAFGLRGHAGYMVDNRGITVSSPRSAIRNGVYFVSASRDDEGLVPDMSASDNLILPWLKSYVSGPFLSARRAMDGFRVTQKALNILGGHANAPVSVLSGGNRQKVFLGRWFFGAQPRVLLLCQPTQGVDVGARMDIAAAVRKMADSGVTIIVASSESDEIELLCDRSYVCEGPAWPMVEPTENWSETMLETLVQIERGT